MIRRVQEDEWRIDVELDDERYGYSLGERLRAHDLDDKARERIGSGVVVTREGSRLFLYARDPAQAAEAERIVRDLLDAEELSGSISTLRWHPDEEDWKDAALPLPHSPEARAAEDLRREEREQREAEAEGEYDWHVRASAPSRHEAVELERRLREQGLPVDRRWVHLTVGVPTEERASELADELRADAPAETEVWVEPADMRLPFLLFFGV